MNSAFMKTIWKGRKDIDWLEVTLSGNSFFYPEDIQSTLQEKWHEIYHQEKEKGKKIRDSDLYRVDEIYIGEESCKLLVGNMKRSQLFIVKFCQDLFEDKNETYFPNGIACAGLVETGEGKFIFGKRNSNNAGRIGGEIALVGGTLQSDEGEVYSYRGFYDHMVRELAEETGIEKQYIGSAKIVGIIRMQNGGFGFVYYIKLTIESQQILPLFLQRTDDEMAELIFVERNNAYEFLYESCFEEGILKRSLGLSLDFLEEIFSHTM